MKIAVGIDNIRSYSKDKADLDYFITKVRAAGHTVESAGVGPNTVQHYMERHSGYDLMIQIAGGLCLGTTIDFSMGAGAYYGAKKAMIIYYLVGRSLNPDTWPACRSDDDHFSREADISPYYGKTLPQIYSQLSNKLYKYVGGHEIEDVTNKFLNSTGSSSTTTEQVNSSSSALDLIKQVCSDWDGYGVDLDLYGDTVSIKKTNPNGGVALNESKIVNNSVSFADYDSATPNTNGSAKDQYLIDRFGSVPLQTELTDQQAQVLQMGKRGFNHSIDLKCILDEKITAGSWVKLTLSELGITNRPYYVSKCGISEDRTQTLTLTDGPPSLYVEITETETTGEETTEDTETEEEE